MQMPSSIAGVWIELALFSYNAHRVETSICRGLPPKFCWSWWQGVCCSTRVALVEWWDHMILDEIARTQLTKYFLNQKTDNTLADTDVHSQPWDKGLPSACPVCKRNAHRQVYRRVESRRWICLRSCTPPSRRTGRLGGFQEHAKIKNQDFSFKIKIIFLKNNIFLQTLTIIIFLNQALLLIN